jgi:cyclic-di-GMP-binding biofilm dispersal mediator protein
MTAADSPKHPVAGSHALVAGATGGLGSAIARSLHRRGAELTLVARRSERLDALDVPGHRVAVDLRDPHACHKLVRETRDRAGRLDVIVNAVGIVAFGPVSDLSVDAMEELFLTNTFPSIMLGQASMEAITPGGVIVNISGVIAEQNLPGMAVYGASKAAVRAFDEALAREGRRRQVRVLDARPPHTETGLADRPLEGTAPKMPTGLDPVVVADIIVDAIESGATDLPSEAFGR